MKAFLLYGKLALRNVCRNRRRSLFTIISISFGLFCLIVFQALKVGLHREMVDGTVLIETGSMQIHSAQYEENLNSLKALDNPDEIGKALRANGIERYSRRLRASALVQSPAGSTSVILTGVNPVEEPRVTCIFKKMIRGNYLADETKVLIGSDLADNLGVNIGGELHLLAQDSSGAPVSESFEIGGIYKTGLSSFNRSRIFLPLSAAQRYLRSEGLVTEISAITDRAQEQNTADRLKRVLSREYQVRTWREIAPDLSQLIEMNDATMRLLILIVFAIVALGIANTMTMTVFERFRELGVLMAIGTTPFGILAMITLESLFLGFGAAALGSFAGIGACAWLANHGIDMNHFTSSNKYFAMTHVIKACLIPGDLMSANVVASVTALIAGLHPAWKAARLIPVKAITHN
jgi:ABC-type lipoprotein release transport system permease subunit